MRRTSIATGFAAVVVMASVAGTGYATHGGWHTVGRASAAGDYAIAIASANVRRPVAVAVRVLSRPRQRVSGNWTIVCSKGFGAGSKSGRFSGRTPLTRLMRLPMRRPSDCTAAASAQLDRSGSLKVRILKR